MNPFSYFRYLVEVISGSHAEPTSALGISIPFMIFASGGTSGTYYCSRLRPVTKKTDCAKVGATE